MTNLFEKIPPYSEVKSAAIHVGLDNKTLAEIAKSGFHPSMSRMLAFNHGLTAKDIQDKVSEYSTKTVTSRDLLSKVYQDVLSNQSKEGEKKNDLQKLFIKGKTECVKSDSFERFLSDYMINSRFTVDDTAFHLVYGNQDYNLLKKDPELALNYYELFSGEIEDHLKGLKDSEVLEALHSLGCYPQELNNQKILRTRLFLKSMAHQLSHGDVNEKLKAVDKELTDKYMNPKSKKTAPKKRFNSTKKELEMA